MKKLALLLFTLFAFAGRAQIVYEDINNTGIYDFLDELANLKIISINSAVKPYSRKFIAGKLVEAYNRTNSQPDTLTKKKALKLTKRQTKELLFYLQDYQLDISCAKTEMESASVATTNLQPETTNLQPATFCLPEYNHTLGFLFKKQPNFAVPLNPLAFQYKDRLFTLSLRPVGGISYLVNENGSMYQRYWGAATFMYIGKYAGGYASLRDNYATQLVSEPLYLTREPGGVYKVNEGGRVGGDWSEMRGGVNISWNWGSIGLMKDFFTWGNNAHGANILSGHAPSFPYIQLHLNPVKWFDFNYIHGWLASKVVDSTRSYYTDDGTYRIVYHSKYIAANLFTFIPFKHLTISFGNSVIYSGEINPAFLIPFMFFKSVDHSTYFNNDAGSNAQMFFDISSRQIRHLHLYVTLFIDELKMSRILKKDENNFTSWKFGVKLSDFPIRNLALTAEYTRTQPGTYQHYISTTTYTSNKYNMGHYMRDNAQELYVSLSWKPLRGLLVNGSYTLAQHGDDFDYVHGEGYDITRVPVLQNLVWENYQVELMARYELVSDIYFRIHYLNTLQKGDVRFSPEIMLGRTNTLIIGVNVGF